MTPPFVSDLAPRDSNTTEYLSRGETIGLAFDSFAGLASTIAATLVLTFIVRRKYREQSLRLEALEISVIALFFAEVIQSLGEAVNVKWVIDGKTVTGAFCTMQGVLQFLGGTCVALVTLTIAVQTFLTIWWLKYPNKTISAFVIFVEFLFVTLFVAITFGVHTHPPREYYAAPTPYWCYIGNGFPGQRIGGDYLWLWVALFGSLALYPPLFLLHRNIVRPGTTRRWYSPAAEPTSRLSFQNEARRVLSRGDLQLWSTILYPTLYCIAVLPLSIVRWIGFREEAAGKSYERPVATFLVIILFTSCGVLNALLYSLTRSRFFWAEKKDDPIAPSIKMTPTPVDASTRSNTD